MSDKGKDDNYVAINEKEDKELMKKMKVERKMKEMMMMK